MIVFVAISQTIRLLFSFHPRKVITTGEGGMITTNRPIELAEKIKLSRESRRRADGCYGYRYEAAGVSITVGRYPVPWGWHKWISCLG